MNEPGYDARRLAEAMIVYRATHELSQEQFGKMVKLDRTTILKAENGKRVSPVTAAKIMLFIKGGENNAD